MQRDPWSNEQLRFERKVEGFWPEYESRADRIVFWGVAIIALMLALGVAGALTWQ